MEMSVSLSQQMNLTEVAALYEQVQADLPEPVRLRVYRAMSWLKQAQQSTESDVQFMPATCKCDKWVATWLAFAIFYRKCAVYRPMCLPIWCGKFIRKAYANCWTTNMCFKPIGTTTMA